MLENIENLDISNEERFDMFYREHGVRTLMEMVKLRSNIINDFELPIATDIHYTLRDLETLGITENDPLLAKCGKSVYVDFIEKYLHQPITGLVSPISRQFRTEVTKYLNTQTKLKWINANKTATDVSSNHLVVSYNSVDDSYRYKSAINEAIDRRVNYYNTVFKSANDYVTKGRDQIIVLEAGLDVLALSKLEELEETYVKAMVSKKALSSKAKGLLSSDSLFMLFQMYLWAGDNTKHSVLSQVDAENQSRITLMFLVDNKYTLIKLSQLRAFIRRPEDVDSKALLTPKKAQKVVLKFFLGLKNQKTRAQEDDVIIDLDSVDEVTARAQGQSETVAKIENTKDMIQNGGDKAILNVKIDGNGHIDKDELNLNVKTKRVANSGLNKVQEFEGTDRDLLGMSDEFSEILDLELDRDLAQLEAVEAQRDANKLNLNRSYVKYKAKEPEAQRDYIESCDDIIDDYADRDLLSPAEVRRAKNLARRCLTIKSPWDENQTLEEYAKITTEDLAISKDTEIIKRDIKGMVDKSMKNYSLKDFHSGYIEKVMNKDIVNALLHVQRSGIAVTNLTRTEEHSYLGSHQILSVQLTPIIGEPTTVKIKLPIFNKDGIFKSNNVKQRIKTQRVDAPIRKVSDTHVALTNSINKMFVYRSDRAAFNSTRWFMSQLNLHAMSEDTKFSNIIYTPCFYRDLALPRDYCMMAKSISSLDYREESDNNIHYSFDYAAIDKVFGAGVLDAVQKYNKDLIPVGKGADGLLHVMYKDGTILTGSILTNGSFAAVKKPGYLLEEMFGFLSEKKPVDFAETKVLGKKVPLGFILGYQIGLGNLLKTSGVKYRRISSGTRADKPAKDEFGIRFDDETLVFSRKDQTACLLFGGFNRAKNLIKKKSVYSYDKKLEYRILLEEIGIPARLVKEYDEIFRSWVDNQTYDALITMKEPTDMVELYLSCINKLSDDQYKDPNGMEGSLLRGYERIPTMISMELEKAIRRYNRNPSKNSKIEINPNAVWYNIIQDQTVTPIEESNPVHAIKEKEIVVFRGAGGRSAQSMTAAHRQYGDDSIGIISEANVDNGSVGTITYLTADPNITNLRGVCEPLKDVENAPATKLQSTAMLLSPGSDTDDQRSINL